MRRLGLICSIAALSAVGFSPKAQAQSADVDFAGSIPASCAIVNSTNGTLRLMGNFEGTQALVSYPDQGATPGYLTVSCNSGVTFQMTSSSVTNNGTTATSFSNLNINASMIDQQSQYQNLNLEWGRFASSVQGPLANKTYEVHLNVRPRSGTTLPTGTYGVRVNIALTPQ